MIVKGLGLIASPSLRARAYIQKLVANDLYPSHIILMKGKRGEVVPPILENSGRYPFRISEPVLDTIEKHNLDYEQVNANDINDDRILDAVKRREERFFVFTGGGIIGKRLLSIGKEFIHLHPGIVPGYRGSTCIYYSIIEEGKCSATAFLMRDKVDTGPVIARKMYEMPRVREEEWASIDYVYDPEIRSDLLVDVARNYVENGGNLKQEAQDPNKGETYHIIHPVLKHLAILRCIR